MSRFEFDGSHLTAKKVRPGERCQYTLRGTLDKNNVVKVAHKTAHPATYADMTGNHWLDLADELGFDPQTVQAVRGDAELFSAVNVR